jgi:hypothetical protein
LMANRPYAAVFSVVLAVVACGDDSFPSATGQSRVNGPEPVTGLFRFGSEVQSFIPCGDTLEYWVTGRDEVWLDLRDRYDALMRAPYEPVFLRAVGMPTGRDSVGFAAEYDGVFRLDSVLEVSRSLEGAC